MILLLAFQGLQIQGLIAHQERYTLQTSNVTVWQLMSRGWLHATAPHELT